MGPVFFWGGINLFDHFARNLNPRLNPRPEIPSSWIKRGALTLNEYFHLKSLLSALFLD